MTIEAPEFRDVSRNFIFRVSRNYPVLVLLRLRHRYPQISVAWDEANRRAIAHPARLLRQSDDTLKALTDAKEVIVPILQWEYRTKTTTVLSAEEEHRMEWLVTRATPGFWPRSFELRKGHTVVDPIKLSDSLEGEIALGPAGISWRRAIDDIGLLMNLDREGRL